MSFEHLKTDEYYMQMALKLAKEAGGKNEVPVGAVIVASSGNIIGMGYNSPIASKDPTAHAEIVAIREASRKLGNYRLLNTTMYVTIEPCPMCAGALIHARVKRLVFGAHDPKGGACGSLYNLVHDTRLNHRLDVKGGVLAHRARDIIQAFFKKRRMTRGEVPKRP